MVLYFTGTGNSRYLARCIAEGLEMPLYDLNACIKAGDTAPVQTGRDVVLVTPTYAWRIPRVVSEWLDKTALTGAERIWFVMNCGSEIGNAAGYNRQLAAQKQLQIAAFRRCMVQIVPVPGPAATVGAHQPDPPPVGRQTGGQQVGCWRLALRAGHADHGHGAGRFAVEPRGQSRHGTPRVARPQHGTPGGQAGHIMGAEHRRGPGSDGLRRKVVAVGVPPGQTDEQRPPARHSGSHSRRT